MKTLFGFNGIVAQGKENAPSASELCKKDKRLLYVGNIRDSQGNLIEDSFMHVLNPTELYTIEKSKLLEENLYLLRTDSHHIDKNSPVLNYLYDNHRGEIYVGDVCDGSGRTGEVWHDTYKMGLRSKTLYTKNEDGSRVLVEPPVEDCFSVPDRYAFRVVLKTPHEPQQHFAFFYGISAFNKWTYLKYNAKKGQIVLHSLDPDYKNFLYHDECDDFEKYPQLVKAYPKCYSRKGYLNLGK